ncbi:MAG: diaminopimelate epimerase [Planctomycetota bacterium]|jgi:diaminopimelate epimerase
MALVPDGPGTGPDSGPDTGRWSMALFNSDGSRAELSGNGLRGVGQALARHVGQDGACDFEVDTDAGLRRVEVLDQSGVDARVRVHMGYARPGPPLFSGWEALGVKTLREAGVDVGNPHLVALVADLDAHDLATAGPAVEASYPAGVNVHLITIDSRQALQLRVWERGAGITQACGTGACAAVAAARAWGLVDDTVEVSMPGGEATVECSEDGELRLTGPVRWLANLETGD